MQKNTDTKLYYVGGIAVAAAIVSKNVLITLASTAASYYYFYNTTKTQDERFATDGEQTIHSTTMVGTSVDTRPPVYAPNVPNFAVRTVRLL